MTDIDEMFRAVRLQIADMAKAVAGGAFLTPSSKARGVTGHSMSFTCPDMHSITQRQYPRDDEMPMPPICFECGAEMELRSMNELPMCPVFDLPEVPGD